MPKQRVMKKNVPAANKTTKPINLTLTKQKEIWKDLRDVLKKHSLPTRIESMSLIGNVGGLCDCGGGKLGRLVMIVEGGRQVLVCDCG